MEIDSHGRQAAENAPKFHDARYVLLFFRSLVPHLTHPAAKRIVRVCADIRLILEKLAPSASNHEPFTCACKSRGENSCSSRWSWPESRLNADALLQRMHCSAMILRCKMHTESSSCRNISSISGSQHSVVCGANHSHSVAHAV